MAPLPPPPDRLSALDAAFLDLETARAPLHVGWTLVFDGAPPSLAALRRHVDSRLAGIPRFRRRVVQPALGLGDAHWTDDGASTSRGTSTPCGSRRRPGTRSCAS